MIPYDEEIHSLINTNDGWGGGEHSAHIGLREGDGGFGTVIPNGTGDVLWYRGDGYGCNEPPQDHERFFRDDTGTGQ